MTGSLWLVPSEVVKVQMQVGEQAIFTLNTATIMVLVPCICASHRILRTFSNVWSGLPRPICFCVPNLEMPRYLFGDIVAMSLCTVPTDCSNKSVLPAPPYMSDSAVCPPLQGGIHSSISKATLSIFKRAGFGGFYQGFSGQVTITSYL